MIDYLPILTDGLQYHAFVPMLSTLYGRDDEPHRFLRVLDKGIADGRYTQTIQNGDTLCVIENVDIETYITFLSYGYTPYMECALTGYNSGIGLEDFQQFFVSQACIRNYESRIQSLLEAAENKKLSLIGNTKMTTETAELCDEIDGVLAMWEMLMNTGTARPRNCLEISKMSHRNEFRIPMKRFQDKYEELDERMLYNNYSDLPFKITDDRRRKLLSAFNCC